MSSIVFDDLNGGMPTHRNGTLRAEIAFASSAARAAYSLFQPSERTVSRTPSTSICWRSLAPIMTTIAAGRSAVISSPTFSGQLWKSSRTKPDDPLVRSTIFTLALCVKAVVRPSARPLPRKSPTTSTTRASGRLVMTATWGGSTPSRSTRAFFFCCPFGLVWRFGLGDFGRRVFDAIGGLGAEQPVQQARAFLLFLAHGTARQRRWPLRERPAQGRALHVGMRRPHRPSSPSIHAPSAASVSRALPCLDGRPASTPPGPEKP